jgi:hypothetical protein
MAARGWVHLILYHPEWGWPNPESLKVSVGEDGEVDGDMYASIEYEDMTYSFSGYAHQIMRIATDILEQASARAFVPFSLGIDRPNPHTSIPQLDPSVIAALRQYAADVEAWDRAAVDGGGE